MCDVLNISGKVSAYSFRFSVSEAPMVGLWPFSVNALDFFRKSVRGDITEYVSVSLVNGAMFVLDVLVSAGVHTSSS